MMYIIYKEMFSLSYRRYINVGNSLAPCPLYKYNLFNSFFRYPNLFRKSDVTYEGSLAPLPVFGCYRLPTHRMHGISACLLR